MFFSPDTVSKPGLSMDQFKEWANGIASSYLNTGFDPTEGVIKIAQSEDLTPHHIEVLAAETNKTIHLQKFGQVTDKYFAADFPLADAKKAIAACQADGGEIKHAVEMPEPIVKKASIDPYSLFGVEEEQMDKTAEVRHDLKHASQRLELVNDALQDKLIMTKRAADETERDFIKKARQIVLQGQSSSERLQILGQIDHFMKCSSMDFAKPSLAKLAHVLMREGLLNPQHSTIAIDYLMSKTADEKAPKEMISDWIEARVVNGNHPLYITLKTFKDQKNALRLNGERYQLTKDQVGPLQQRIRAL